MPLKKRVEEHENHERWLVSYADFITLLFAFFTVMFGISQVDLAKFKRVSAALKLSFGGFGNSPLGSTPELEMPENWRYAPLVPNVIPDDDVPLASAADRTLFGTMQSELQKVLKAQGLDGAVSITKEERQLVIRMGEARVFEPGSTRMLPAGRQLFDRIGSLVRSAPNPIVIEARVLTLRAAGMPSTYELFSDRAARMVRMLTEEEHVDPARITLLASSHFVGNGKGSASDSPLLNPTPLSITLLPEAARPRNGG